MAALIVNPKKRKTTKKRSVKKSSARRKNPIASRKGMLEKTIMPALVAGAGAVGANMAYNYAAKFLPVEWQQGNIRYLAEGASILAIGMALEQTKIIKDKKTRTDLIQGALTVTAYRAIDAIVTPMLPAGMAGYESLGGYASTGGLGYTSTGGPIMSGGKGSRFA